MCFITEKYPGPVTNVFLANSFLPNDFDGYYLKCYIAMIIHAIILCRPGMYNLTSSVQVVQINASGRVELPDDGSVSIIFNIPEVVNYV